MLHRLANGNFPSFASPRGSHSLARHSIVVMYGKTFPIIIIIITFTFNPEAIKQPRSEEAQSTAS
jgi:hypothetical protein